VTQGDIAPIRERTYVEHGSAGCSCDGAGEDPRCQFHGYEAVIRRLEEERDALRAELERERSDAWEALDGTNVETLRDALDGLVTATVGYARTPDALSRVLLAGAVKASKRALGEDR
jgi:hypothetical protein